MQICCAVNPEKAAPVTVNEALSPGASPSFGEPPLKLPEFPVMKPKSSTAELNPGTVPRAASEKVKFADKLGACMPVKPFNPEALALPRGGKSNPIPVIVEVPGDVFVIVKVKVFVCELKLQTTVAVAACPEFTPEMVKIGRAHV